MIQGGATVCWLSWLINLFIMVNVFVDPRLYKRKVGYELEKGWI